MHSGCLAGNRLSYTHETLTWNLEIDLWKSLASSTNQWVFRLHVGLKTPRHYLKDPAQKYPFSPSKCPFRAPVQAELVLEKATQSQARRGLWTSIPCRSRVRGPPQLPSFHSTTLLSIPRPFGPYPEVRPSWHPTPPPNLSR